MIYCPNCGKQVDERYEICAHCGRILMDLPAAPVAIPNAGPINFSGNVPASTAGGEPIGFGKAVKLFFKNYAKFKGRATRAEFWYVVLFNFLVSLVPGILSGVATAIESETLRLIGSGISGLYALATLIPGLALTVRRLHDTNHSGWLAFLGYLLSAMFLAAIVTLGVQGTPIEGVISVISKILAAYLIYFIYMLVLFLKGSGPDNKYGPRYYK